MPPTNGAIEKEEWLTVTQVARLLKKRYHKARDLILLGTFGESKYATALFSLVERRYAPMPERVEEFVESPAVEHVYRQTLRRELFLGFAESLAILSTCNRLQVGCVITNAELTQVLAIGYNGNARGLANRCDRADEPGNCGCLHAEMNALLKVDGSIPNKILFTSVSPCVQCAKAIINSNVGTVFYSSRYRDESNSAFAWEEARSTAGWYRKSLGLVTYKSESNRYKTFPGQTQQTLISLGSVTNSLTQLQRSPPCRSPEPPRVAKLAASSATTSAARSSPRRRWRRKKSERTTPPAAKLLNRSSRSI